MAVLPIVTYGHKVLKAGVRQIETIDDNVKKLAAGMLETMHEVNGLGLAATQVGQAQALFVINGPAAIGEAETSTQPDMVMLNPEITNAQGKDTMEEGCLSVPGVRLDVTRAESLDLAYTDLDGQRRSLHAEGMLAKVIQHEMDHLNGMLIVDRISSLKRQLIRKQLKELAAETLKTTRSAGKV